MSERLEYSSIDFESIDRFYRTGALAEICQVSAGTMEKCLKNGKIKGCRIPGSRHWRAHHKELLRFMREYGLPINNLEEYVRTHPE